MKKFFAITLLGLAGLFVMVFLQPPSPALSSPLGFTNTPVPTNAPTPVAPPTATPTAKPHRPPSSGKPPADLPKTGNGALASVHAASPAVLGDFSIPSQGVDAALQVAPRSGPDWDISALGQSVGWLEDTARPGQAGNSVLVGHLDLIYGMDGPFARLNQLKAGDEIDLILGSRRYVYQVSALFILNATDTWVLADTLPSQLTLLTCLRGSWSPQLAAYQKRLLVTTRLVRIEPVAGVFRSPYRSGMSFPH